MKKKKLICYNCTGVSQPVFACRSVSYSRCNQRHDTSIRQLQEDTSLQHSLKQTSLYIAEETQEANHPTEAIGKYFLFFLDTGAGISYVSSAFISHVNQQPLNWESKALEMMATTATKKLLVFYFETTSLNGSYTLNIKANKLDRIMLKIVNNPRAKKMKEKYPYLAVLKFDSEYEKNQHFIHIILGAGDIAKIKSGGFIAGKTGEAVTEKTVF